MQHLTVFIFGLACLAVSAKPMSDEEKAHFEGMKDKCVEKSGVDVALFDRLKAGEAIVGEKSLDCFGACMLQELDIMDEAGAMKMDEAMRKIPAGIPHDKAEELVNLCTKDLPEGDACAAAAAVFGCMHEHEAMKIFHPMA